MAPRRGARFWVAVRSKEGGHAGGTAAEGGQGGEPDLRDAPLADGGGPQRQSLGGRCMASAAGEVGSGWGGQSFLLAAKLHAGPQGITTLSFAYVWGLPKLSPTSRHRTCSLTISMQNHADI